MACLRVLASLTTRQCMYADMKICTAQHTFQVGATLRTCYTIRFTRFATMHVHPGSPYMCDSWVLSTLNTQHHSLPRTGSTWHFPECRGGMFVISNKHLTQKSVSGIAPMLSAIHQASTDSVAVNVVQTTRYGYAVYWAVLTAC